MVKKIKSLDETPVDVFEAVKRVYIKRGRIRGRFRRRKNSKQGSTKSSTQGSSNSNGSSTTAETPEATEPQDVHEKLIDITEKAQDVLFQADTIFPFTLFPDTVTLDREKLTVATRVFFRTAKIVSVPISSISSAEIDVGPFFASLKMASKFFVQNTYTVNFLTRGDAQRLHHLLQGFMIAQEKDIDVTDIEKDDLLILLDDLGQGVRE